MDQIAAMLVALDPTPSHVLAREAIRAALVERRPGHPIAAHGPWEGAVASIGFAILHSNSRKLEARDWAQRVLLGSHGLDSNVLTAHGHRLDPAGPVADAQIELAAEVLVADDGVHLDRLGLWKPVTQAIAAGRSDILVVCMELARDLDESGQPEQAWTALSSAAFWATCQQGHSPRAVFDAAHALAHGQGWTRIREHLDELASS